MPKLTIDERTVDVPMGQRLVLAIEALGVDTGDEIPLRLYQSAGFETISTTLILEKTIESAGASSKPSMYSEDFHERP